MASSGSDRKQVAFEYFISSPMLVCLFSFILLSSSLFYPAQYSLLRSHCSSECLFKVISPYWAAGCVAGRNHCSPSSTRWRTWPSSWRYLWKAAQHHRKQHISPLLSPSLQTSNMHNVKDSNNQYPRRIIISLTNQTRSNVKLIPFHVNLILRLKQNIKNWIEWWFQLTVNFVFLHSLNIYYSWNYRQQNAFDFLLLCFCSIYMCDYLSGSFLQKPENLLN